VERVPKSLVGDRHPETLALRWWRGAVSAFEAGGRVDRCVEGVAFGDGGGEFVEQFQGVSDVVGR
jgi:hypothetical protein